MITIRVVAWRERAYLTAHAIKTTPRKSPSVPSGEPTADLSKWAATRPASIQFRRTLPTPSHWLPTSATTYDNLRDGVVGTRLPHSTCSLSDSLQKPFLIRQRALLLLQQKGFSQTCEHPIPGNFPHATSNDRTRLCHSSLSFSIMRCAELQLLYSTFQMQLKTEGVDSRYVLLFWAKAQFRENVL